MNNTGLSGGDQHHTASGVDNSSLGTHTRSTSHWVEKVEVGIDNSSIGDTHWINITLG